jgi:hypothetical protein
MGQCKIEDQDFASVSTKALRDLNRDGNSASLRAKDFKSD